MMEENMQGCKLKIYPEILAKLSSGKEKLWVAAHPDGSDNRINGDVILEASSYGTGFGLLAAAAQLIRRRFRNRGKTRSDLLAEKEAAEINRTCIALEEMLLEYFQAVQNGSVDEEALNELIDTLEKMHGYFQSGKLRIPGEKDLVEMRKCIADYTAAITGDQSPSPVGKAESSGKDEFFLIRELLLRQKGTGL